MSGIDNRIVAMKFDNAQFERGVSTTISSMDKLKQSLNFTGAQKGLQDLGGSIAKFNVGGMEGAVTSVSNAFLALSTIGITALSNITNKAVNAGTQLVKSLTIAPVSAGLHEYETNLKSIQTILANTQKEGANLEDVNKALDQLNEYSDKTIYNFSEMARNIGTFTAAGVKLDTSVAAIKGISNLAAVSGSNADQASTAMYQLSQALATGRVALMDWNSVVNAGMGGAVFQDALKRTARNHGINIDAMIKKEGSFRDTLKNGWLSSKVLTETLAQFTGDLSDEQLRQQGYSAQQIKDIQDLAKTAVGAATEVKTMGDLINTLQETAGSGWADTWELIFGDFEEAKELFTGLNDAIGGWIKSSADARNKLVGDWKDLGGRTHLIEALKNIFEALGRVLKPIKDAFRDIFPPMTGQRLYDLTIGFENFTKRLKISDEVMENLKRTFSGIFAVFSIIKSFAFGVVKVIMAVFDALAGPTGGAGGGFLAMTASIGDFVVGIDQMLKRSKIIEKFFGAIGGAIAGVITLIADVARSLFGLFTGGETSFLDDLSSRFENLAPIIEGIKTKIQDIVGAIKGIFSGFHIDTDMFGLTPAVDKASGSLERLDTAVEDTTSFLDDFKQMASNVATGIGNVFSWLGEQIAKITEATTLEDWLALINTGFFIALVRMLRSFTKSVGRILEAQADILDNVAKVVNNFSGVMKGMQQNLKADALMKLAIALLILVGAIWLLSLIDPKDIAVGLGVMVAMLYILTKALDKLDASFREAGQFAALSAAIVVFAVAMLAMAGAVAAFGQMGLDTLAKGFGAVIATIAIMTGAMAAMSAVGGPKALAGIAGGLMLMAIALSLLAGVVLMFDRIDTGTMISGLIKMAAVLALVAGFMWVISGLNMTGSMVGLIAAAIAINILAGALKNMGDIGIWQLVKGLGAMAIALAILATALWVMETTLPGAAALLVAVIALKLLVPVIKELGELSWGTLGKGLLALAAAFVVIALGGFLLTPVIPILLLFGAAVALVGAAMFLAGIGMLAFSTGLALLAVSGAAGFAVLTAAIITFVELLPLIGQQLGLAIVAWAKVIGEKAPEIIKALGQLFSELLREMRRRAPEFFQTMFVLLFQLLRAIYNNMDEIADAAVALITKFVDEMATRENINKITTAGADLIINLANGIADAIRKNDDKFAEAGENIAGAIIGGLVTGIIKNKFTPIGALLEVIDQMKGSAKHELLSNSPSRVYIDIGKTIPQGLAVGIDKYSNLATTATEEMGEDTVTAMQQTIDSIFEALDQNLDSEPTITPVLDLSEIVKTASQLDTILQTNPVAANVTRDQATSVATMKQPLEDIGVTPGQEPKTIKFEQNNYSPKALTPSEIYRNTRNQLAFAREVMVG